MRKTQSEFIFGPKNITNTAVFWEMANMWFKNGVFSNKPTACCLIVIIFFLTYT